LQEEGVLNWGSSQKEWRARRLTRAPVTLSFDMQSGREPHENWRGAKTKTVSALLRHSNTSPPWLDVELKKAQFFHSVLSLPRTAGSFSTTGSRISSSSIRWSAPRVRQETGHYFYGFLLCFQLLFVPDLSTSSLFSDADCHLSVRSARSYHLCQDGGQEETRVRRGR
jgi:hypothetical protein